jgi:hypothetical protein
MTTDPQHGAAWKEAHAVWLDPSTPGFSSLQTKIETVEFADYVASLPEAERDYVVAYEAHCEFCDESYNPSGEESTFTLEVGEGDDARTLVYVEHYQNNEGETCERFGRLTGSWGAA